MAEFTFKPSEETKKRLGLTPVAEGAISPSLPQDEDGGWTIKSSTAPVSPVDAPARPTFDMPTLPSQVANNIPFLGPIVGGLEAGASLFNGGDPTANEGAGQRVIGIAGSESLKGTLSFGEWALDTVAKATAMPEGVPDFGPAAAIKGTLGVFDHLLGTNLADPDMNYVEENMPVVKANSEYEQVAGEIGAIIAGAAGGSGVASKIDDAVGWSKGLGEVLAGMYTRATRLNPKNAERVTQLLAKSLLIETGANIGSTITTPTGTKSFSEQAWGVDGKAGVLLDNTIASGALGIVFKALGMGKNFVANKFFGGKHDTASRSVVVEQIMNDIDPGLEGASADIVADRLNVLSEALQKHKATEINMPDVGKSNINSTSTIALQRSLKEYVEKAYGFMKRDYSPEEWTKWADERANLIMTNFVSMRGSRTGSPVVQAADAQLNAEADLLLDKKANTSATVDESMATGEALGQSILKPLQDQSDSINDLRKTVRTDEDVLSNEQADNFITQLVENGQRQNMLGSSDLERQTFAMKTTEQLVTTYKRMRDEVNAAFRAIPRIALDEESAQTLAGTVQSLGNEIGPLDQILSSPPSSGVKALSGQETDKLIESLTDGTISLQDLYGRVRPALVKQINMLRRNPDANVDFEALEALKAQIDELGNASAEPAVKNAMAKYAHFADVWKSDDLIEAFSKTARVVQKMPNGQSKNLAKAQKEGFNLVMSALNDDSGVTLNKLMAALKEGEKYGVPTDPNLASTIVGHALKSVTTSVKAGQKVDSLQLVRALSPYIDAIREVDKPLATKLTAAAESLQRAEVNLAGNKNALDAQERLYQQLIDDSSSQAESKFLSEVSGKGDVLQPAGQGWRKIFSSNNAVAEVGRLIGKAKDSPQVIKSIKGQFVRYLKDKAFTKTTNMGVSNFGQETVQDASASQLSRILDATTDPTLGTLKKVFQDDPQSYEAIKTVLELVNSHVSLRSTKAVPFGSSTTIDLSNKIKRDVNLMTAIVFGRLNKTATTINAITDAMTGNAKKDINKAAEWMLDQTLTDPEFFSKGLRMVASDLTGQTFGKFIDKIIAPVGKAAVEAGRPREDKTEEAFGMKG